MIKHIQTVSQEKIALADNGGGDAGGILPSLLELFNPILTLNFIVAVLAAVNDFLVRKAGAQ